VTKRGPISPGSRNLRSHQCGLFLEGTNDRVRGISWNDLGVVKHVELLGGVAPCIEHDSLLSSWVVRQEGRDIKDLFSDDNPDVILLRVFGNLVEGENFGSSLRWLSLRLRIWLCLWLEARSVN
jgi:hypothetical protein